MTATVLAERLSELMNEEAELLNRISEEEEKLQQVLRHRNWPEMEGIMTGLGRLSAEMDSVEASRNNVYASLKERLGKSESDGFYSVVMNLEGEVRESCLSGYRRMKVALLRMQGVTSSIDQYVNTVGKTTQRILSEIFPYRKGNIYSRNGSPRPVQSDPMVLSRHL